MGVWKVTTLDNDTGADFVIRAAKETNWTPIACALAKLLPIGDLTWDNDDILEAIAAAEFVAASLDNHPTQGHASTRGHIATFVYRSPCPTPLLATLADLALATLKVDATEWRHPIADLRLRLEPLVQYTPEAFATEWLKLQALDPDVALSLLVHTPSDLRAKVKLDSTRLANLLATHPSRAARTALTTLLPLTRPR